MSLKKILVGLPYPNHGFITTPTKKSLEYLIKDCQSLSINIKNKRGTCISYLRNTLITKSEGSDIHPELEDFDYYLSLDADIEFRINDLKKLIEADKDIISGLYKSRIDSLNKNYVAGYLHTYEDQRVRIGRKLQNEDLTLPILKVDWAGAGFLLVKRSVFETLEYPWFREHLFHYEESGKEQCSQAGEDIGFCMHARKAGIDIYIHSEVKLMHYCSSPEIPYDRPVF